MRSGKYWDNIYISRVLRHSSRINHHITSTIWLEIKSNYNCVIDQTCWSLGDGSKIDFWRDAWCGEPLQIDLIWLAPLF